MSWSFWLILGLGLLVFEILTPGGFFTLFFGLAAFMVALLAGLGVLTSGPGQWMFFGVVGALLIVGLVASHWVLDVVTHVPDMPLWPGGSQRVVLSHFSVS